MSAETEKLIAQAREEALYDRLAAAEARAERAAEWERGQADLLAECASACVAAEAREQRLRRRLDEVEAVAWAAIAELPTAERLALDARLSAVLAADAEATP